MNKNLWIVLVAILVCLAIICIVIFTLPSQNENANDTPITNTEEPETPSTVIKWNQVEGQINVSYAPSETAVETKFRDDEIYEYFGRKFLPDRLIDILIQRDSSHTLWLEPDGTAASGGNVASFEYTDYNTTVSVWVFAFKTPLQDFWGKSTDFELSNHDNLEVTEDTVSYINGHPVILMETPHYRQSGEYIRTELNAQFIIDSQTDSENIFITVSCDRNLSKEDFIEIIYEIINF